MKSEVHTYGPNMTRRGALLIAFSAFGIIVLLSIFLNDGRPLITGPLVGLASLYKPDRVQITRDRLVFESRGKRRDIALEDALALRFAMQTGSEFHTRAGDWPLDLDQCDMQALVDDLPTIALHIEISGFRGLYN